MAFLCVVEYLPTYSLMEEMYVLISLFFENAAGGGAMP